MNTDSTPRGDAQAESPSARSERDHLSRRERGVWRAALLLLGALALAFAATSWQSVLSMPHNLEALPVGLVVLVFLFVVYAWSKTNEISELRGLVRGIEQQRTNVGQDTGQLDQLFSLISRSQQGYRDLIDTFEDLLFSVSNDGRILTVNRSFADLLNLSFSEVVGRSMNEFFDLPEASDRTALEQWLPRFVQRRRWTGVVRARVKQTGALRYFDCVFTPSCATTWSTDQRLGARRGQRNAKAEARASRNCFGDPARRRLSRFRDDRLPKFNPALAPNARF